MLQKSSLGQKAWNAIFSAWTSASWLSAHMHKLTAPKNACPHVIQPAELPPTLSMTGWDGEMPTMSRASKAILESRECNYYRWDEATWSNFYNFVTSSPTMPPKCDIMPDAALAAEQPKFDGFWWTSYTSRTWSIPFFACVVYVAMLYTLPVYMAKREKLRLQPIVVAWNFGLSFFSLCGLFYCVPHLLLNKTDGFLTQGLYPSGGNNETAVWSRQVLARARARVEATANL